MSGTQYQRLADPLWISIGASPVIQLIWLWTPPLPIVTSQSFVGLFSLACWFTWLIGDVLEKLSLFLTLQGLWSGGPPEIMLKVWVWRYHPSISSYFFLKNYWLLEIMNQAQVNVWVCVEAFSYCFAEKCWIYHPYYPCAFFTSNVKITSFWN